MAGHDSAVVETHCGVDYALAAATRPGPRRAACRDLGQHAHIREDERFPGSSEVDA